MTVPASKTLDDALPRRRSYRIRLYHGDFFIVRHIGRFLQTQVGQHVHSGYVVADVGCGEQPLRPAIEAAGALYVGLDVVQNSRGTVEHLCSTTALTLPDASADVVLCTEVLEHVSDTMAAFGELGRILRPGGRLILTIPFAYPLHEEPQDFVRLTPHQVRACASVSGLQVDVLQQAGNELEVIATVFDNLWVRMNIGPRNIVGRAIALVGRVILHPLVMAATFFLGGYLPARYFLSTQAVLRKPV